MIRVTIDKLSLLIKPLQEQDINRVVEYFTSLGTDTKKRFAPHPFHAEALRRIVKEKRKYTQYIIIHEENKKILGYFILHSGWIAFDYPRFAGYGLVKQPGDFELAPSIADEWHGQGLGTLMFDQVTKQLIHEYNNPRILLWGGVQASNLKAIRFYEKLGFQILGEFEHHGKNYDMIYESYK
jgi:diamine N-acetyltransferase